MFTNGEVLIYQNFGGNSKEGMKSLSGIRSFGFKIIFLKNIELILPHTKSY